MISSWLMGLRQWCGQFGLLNRGGRCVGFVFKMAGTEEAQRDVEAENEDDSSNSISSQLGEFLAQSGFDEKLFQFLQDEVSNLTIADEGEEQALEVYEAYRKFTQLFDGEFTEFMQSLGIESMEEMSRRLSEEDSTSERASQFLAKLLASMEYPSFVTLAKNFQEADDEDFEGESDDESGEEEGQSGEPGDAEES